MQQSEQQHAPPEIRPEVLPTPVALYVWSTVVLVAIAVAMVVLLAWLRPAMDPVDLLTKAAAVLVPTIAAVIGIIRGGEAKNIATVTYHMVNSRLDAFMAEKLTTAERTGRDTGFQAGGDEARTQAKDMHQARTEARAEGMEMERLRAAPTAAAPAPAPAVIVMPAAPALVAPAIVGAPGIVALKGDKGDKGDPGPKGDPGK